MKPQKLKTKVLIVFPRFNTNDATHYPYWYKLFDEAGKQLTIALLLESGSGDISQFNRLSNVIMQKFQAKPLNLVERLVLMRKLVLQGYSKIYIHYSYWSVIIAWVIKHITRHRLTIYYWDCEFYETKPNNKLLEIALRWCDVLVTGSKSIGEQYRQIFNLDDKKIAVIPNWSEVKPAKKINLVPQLEHVLFVHHLSARKGSRLLPQIIREYLRVNPQTHFHIIGGGPDYDWLKEQLSDMLSKSNVPGVSLYGYLPQDKVRRFFVSCDMFIMPSRSEGFPRVILEAMNYQIPFVATRVGCVAEIVSKTQQQFLTDPNNPDEFVKLMGRLSNYRDKQQLIKANYQAAKYYSLSAAVGAFIKVFKGEKHD